MPDVLWHSGESIVDVHGNKNSKIYHLPDCPGYTEMSPASVIAFASEAEASRKPSPA